MNQLINQAPNIFYMTGGTLKVPLVIRTRVGDGPYGGHPQDYSAWFGHAPGVKVVMPATPPDAMQLMRAAIQDSNPVLFLEPMSLSHGRREVVDVEAGGAELGKARIARGGQDITVVAYGSELPLALQAASLAARESIDVEVIDLRTLVPWDVATVIESVKKTQRLVTVHEAWKDHGHGAEVVARVSEMLGAGIHLRVARVGAKPVPIPSGPLRKWALPSVDEIYSAIMDCVALGETSGG
jgi:pyruvate dehydrogenase E1 component beta subunit